MRARATPAWSAAAVLCAAACGVSADFGGTSYTCPDGQCPSGFDCVEGVCRQGAGEADAARDGDAGRFDAATGDGAGVDLIALEAEDWTYNTERGSYPWVSDSTAGHHGDAAMLAQGPGISSIMYPAYYTDSSLLEYDVDFPEAGFYYLWIRGMSWSGSDTCIPGLDGVGWATAANPDGALGVPIRSPAAWAWGGHDHLDGDRITLPVDSAGVHTVDIWLREDGVILDELVLTLDEGYVPAE